jgi:hypothetical protein
VVADLNRSKMPSSDTLTRFCMAGKLDVHSSILLATGAHGDRMCKVLGQFADASRVTVAIAK